MRRSSAGRLDRGRWFGWRSAGPGSSGLGHLPRPVDGDVPRAGDQPIVGEVHDLELDEAVALVLPLARAPGPGRTPASPWCDHAVVRPPRTRRGSTVRARRWPRARGSRRGGARPGGRSAPPGRAPAPPARRAGSPVASSASKRWGASANTVPGRSVSGDAGGRSGAGDRRHEGHVPRRARAGPHRRRGHRADDPAGIADLEVAVGGRDDRHGVTVVHRAVEPGDHRAALEPGPAPRRRRRMGEVGVDVDPGHQTAPEAEPPRRRVVVDPVGRGRVGVEGGDRVRLRVGHRGESRFLGSPPWRC